MTAYRPSSPDLSRRTVLGATGLAGLALAGLSACGQSGSGSPADGASSTGLTVKAGDIPVGGGKIYDEAGAVVTQPTEGTFKAFSNICTHARCPVHDVTQTINCQCHGSKFAITDGAVLEGPADQPLPARTATVQGDSVVVS